MVVESFIVDGDAVELSSRHAMKQLGSEVPFAVEVEDEEELTTNHLVGSQAILSSRTSKMLLKVESQFEVTFFFSRGCTL
ncbi:hypothetical protein F2Q69_00030459 [Brassica cretica]|nr:hypothetical protein F2Q69_00030459 [Brassica cretica]KAF3610071.1 hypothetical protein DY000_02049002 [Brassica cretica]